MLKNGMARRIVRRVDAGGKKKNRRARCRLDALESVAASYTYFLVHRGCGSEGNFKKRVQFDTYAIAQKTHTRIKIPGAINKYVRRAPCRQLLIEAHKCHDRVCQEEILGEKSRGTPNVI